MQRIVLARRPDGRVTADNFKLEETATPAISDGEILVRNKWLSLDPYMRGLMDDRGSYTDPFAIGDVMEGRGVGEVVESNHHKFAVGDWVQGYFGWQTHAVSTGHMLRKLDPQQAPVSTALSVLGMPGFSAYVGLRIYGKPQPGETIVVSAATGAVGSMVGQLAKLAGLRVVGVAGGEEKCAYAMNTLGMDACIDHRAAADAIELRRKLAHACPDGVDIYFENVGGKTLQAVMPLMNLEGRIPVCGMISWYDSVGQGQGAIDGPNMLPEVWSSILMKRLQVRGFIIMDHQEHFNDFLAETSELIRDKKIVYRETISKGLASAPQAFMDLLRGNNFGKQLVLLDS